MQQLNQNSLQMIQNIVNGMKSHPRFATWEIKRYTYDAFNGVEAMEFITGNSQNLYLFYPNPNGSGKIGSIAIYGAAIDSHYRTMSQSRIIFGLKITNIVKDYNVEGEPFLDIYVTY